MTDILRQLSDIVLTNSSWFPGNRTSENGLHQPQISDLLVPIYLSVPMFITKFVFERYIFESIGRALGLKATMKIAPEIAVLQKVFKIGKAGKSPNNYQIMGLAKQTDLSTRQVERWFRVRRNQDRTPLLKKFIETSWRCLFYLVIFCWGLWIHLDKPCFYSTAECWTDFPHQAVTDDLYWYYTVEAAFYLSLLVCLFTDHKRKDFAEMALHHVVTLMLITLSWVNNFVQIGAVTMVLHDAVDPLLEATKIAKYLGKNKSAEIIFFVFALVWIVTRMAIFPFRLLYSFVYEFPINTNALFTTYAVSIFLGLTLQVLHLIWFYYILLFGYDVAKGGATKDSRSSSESESPSGNEEGRKTE